MKLCDCIEKVTSPSVLKRYATSIVEFKNEKDINQISEELIEQMDMIKRKVGSELDHIEKERVKRLLKPIIIIIMLEERNYQIKSKELFERIRVFEEKVVSDSKIGIKHEFNEKDFKIYYAVLESAWRKDEDISVDEENLLKTLRACH